MWEYAKSPKEKSGGWLSNPLPKRHTDVTPETTGELIPDLIPGLLPRAKLVLLCVPAERGATELGPRLALHVAAGGHPVLVAAYDPTLTYPAAPVPNLVVWYDLRPLDEPPGPVELAVHCHEHRPALVLVDGLLDSLDRANIYRPAPARKLMRRLAHLKSWGATVLVVHFTSGDGRRPLGSVELAAEADLVLLASKGENPRLRIHAIPTTSPPENHENEDHRQNAPIGRPLF